MKYFSMLSLAILLSMCSQSCSNEFELVDASKDIPVVYAIVNKNDTATYFRVERVFVDKTKGADVIAQLPDSLYYPTSVSVWIVRSNVNAIGTLDSFKMSRVDGASEGYPRKAGGFANTPNILYKVRNSVMKLKDKDFITVKVKRADGSVITQNAKQITVLPDMKVVTPDPKTNPSFSFKYDQGFVVSFAVNTDLSRLYDVHLLLNYDETDPDNGNKYAKKTLDWYLDRNLAPTSNISGLSNVSSRKLGADFFKFLRDNVAANGRKRVFKTLEVVVDAAGLEITEFINVNSANTGITGTETLPTTTNLTKGYGIVSSKNRLIQKNFFLDDKNFTFDSLRNGIYTKKLNFQ